VEKTGKERYILRVLVVDDERPCLDELVYMLRKQDGIEIAGAFTNSLEALKASVDLQLDAAFLDLSMPHLSGAELARELLAHSPGIKIVFVTAYRKELSGLRNKPMSGSILKPVSEAKLLKLLRCISD
jgi:DNA-binding NarL/FixJ family response regulator